jgi:tetratricopeptide (TPR) repeat protein
MENSGIGIYFDADEIIDLLNYFEDIEDFDHYKKVVKIGQKLHPHNIDIQIRICKAHIYNNNYEKAFALIEQLGNTENPEIKLLKYECLCALDRYNELITSLETHKTYPDEELQETFEYLAHILHEQHKNEHAYDLVKRGLALFPDNVMMKEELCYHLETQGNIEQATEICKELIDHDPYCVDYWYILGRLYSMMELYDKAIEAYDFALVCDNTDKELKILKAFCHFRNENYEKFTETYVEFFSYNSDFLPEWLQLLIQV